MRYARAVHLGNGAPLPQPARGVLRFRSMPLGQVRVPEADAHRFVPMRHYTLSGDKSDPAVVQFTLK
jgi:hypothetical protein